MFRIRDLLEESDMMRRHFVSVSCDDVFCLKRRVEEEKNKRKNKKK